MKYIIFFVAIVAIFGRAIETNADNLPYGITVMNSTSSHHANQRETNITVIQHGKKVAVFGNYDEVLLYRGDLDGDGYEELVYRGFTGGAHCCFDMTILSLAPKMSAPFTLPMNNTEFIHFKDLDGDKLPEIITWDDSYSYLFFSFASSASVKIVANFNGKKLLIRPELIKKLVSTPSKALRPSKVTIGFRGNLELDDRYAPDVIATALQYFYSAQTDKAVVVLKNNLLFEHPTLRKLFLDALIDAMSRSPYWNQLRHINHWEYNDGGCAPPAEYWDGGEVVSWLFEKMNEHRSIK